MHRRFDVENGAVVASESDGARIQVYVNPDAGEREQLAKSLDLDEHTINSALDPDELARLELHDDHMALIYKRPQNYSSADQYLFRVSSVGVFLYRERLVVVLGEDYRLFDGKPFQKVGSLTEVVLKLLNGTIFHFYGHLKVINIISTEIEQKVNSSMENKYLIHMFTLEKSLVYYLDAINSNGVVIEKMRNNATKLALSTDSVELLDDIMIENRQCCKQAEIYSNILSSLMDARASIVNNNLNLLIKRLTVLSVVFMPLNILAGIGGMSEFTMMTKGVPWPVAYAGFCVGLVGVAFATYWLLVKTGLDYHTSTPRRPEP
jgi:magnesium transporter